ncbi:MAG TPA: hypothetical protein VK718_03085 [Ferruginibacter sp.]|nr:hypothetical protein [Ferruginibacter sp.]
MPINLPLQEFIQYFALQNTNGTIIFYANIVFSKDGRTVERHSEVHIVTVNNKQFIYLIDINKEIPDQFDTEYDTLIYTPTLCLRIDKKDKETIVLIFPKK